MRAQVTAFSNREEKALGRDALVPFLLEDKLREARAPSSSAEERPGTAGAWHAPAPCMMH
jgi:hypothetical protein